MGALLDDDDEEEEEDCVTATLGVFCTAFVS